MLPRYKNQLFYRRLASGWRILLVVVTAALCGHPAVLSAKPGDQDTSFNAAGDKVIWCTTQQPDGKILVGYNETYVPGGITIARLNADGTTDTGFRSTGATSIRCILVQPDGKILVGGDYFRVDGVYRRGLIRLLTDGTPDPSFKVSASGAVYSVALLDTGKILAGGYINFAESGMQRSSLARLNSDGTLDPGFDTGPILDYQAQVTSIAIQPDGMILAAGAFYSINGVLRKGVARLYADGGLDGSFNPAVTGWRGYDGVCLGLNPDGKILVGGYFEDESGSPKRGLERLMPDGTLDPSFTPEVPAGRVNTLAVSAGGKIFLGMDFSSGDSSSHRLIRLNADGTRDATFTPGSLSPPYAIASLAIQADGKLLVFKSGNSKSFVRLENEPAVEKLSAPAFNRVEWLRGGGAPEAATVNFDFSTDNGLTWKAHGKGTWTSGSWNLTGPSLPEKGLLRARATVVGGLYTGSTGLVETMVSFSGFAIPEIAVEGNGREIVTGDQSPTQADHRDFGPVDVRNGTLTRTFTIWNRGAASLELPGTPVVRLEGQDAADFAVNSQPASSIAPGTGVSFPVTFNPRALGTRKAAIAIASQDADERIYELIIQGTGVGLVPELAVSGNGVEIAVGDTTPSPADHTDFGKTASVGGNITRAFTITNSGTGSLKPSGGSLMAITGPHAADFTITSPAVDSVPAGGSAALQITFSPSAPGLRQATIRISSDDEDEGEFLFAVQGSGRFPGEVQAEFPYLKGDRVYAMAEQGDGKILIGQESYTVERHYPDGTIDPSFNGSPSGPVHGVVTQPDGKVLITGVFGTVNGFPAPGIARLLPDGMVDKTFQSEAKPGSVCLAVQPDGKVLLGGGPTVGGEARSLVRLDPSGKLDPTFKNDHDIRDLSCLTLLENGEILIGGSFITVSGTAKQHIARLHADGTLDSGFNASSNGSTVVCMVQQGDGKLIISGPFTSVNNMACNGIARLLPDGSVDTGYLGGTGSLVKSLALQADGGLVIAGSFYEIQGQPRDGVARLTAEGLLDQGFNPQVSTVTDHVLIQGNGQILLGGADNSYGGGVTRLENTPAIHSLTVSAYNRIFWQRGGTSPEASAVIFEASADDGKTWQMLGRGQRISGGWELNGPGLPAAGLLRASAWMVTSPGYGAGGIAAETVTFDGMVPPVISVTGNGVEIKNGDATPETADHRDFGQTAVRGGLVSRKFIIHNPGPVPLNLLGNSPITVAGPGSKEFTVGALSSHTVAKGDHLPFEVFFDPAALGLRTAVIHIACDDFQSADFTFAIQGTGSGLAPEISLTGNGLEIPNGDTIPTAADHTDFGSSRSAEGKVTRTFTISNMGTSELILSGMNISGPQAAEFSLTSSPGDKVPANGQAQFKITFDPSAPKLRTAVVEVASDDDDEPVFRFAIQGTGWAPGDLDPDFRAYPSSIVSSLVHQSDGKILIGGHFGSVTDWSAGYPREATRDFFARLNGNGSLDAPFSVDLATIGSNSCSVRLPDGRLLVGGLTFPVPATGTAGYPLIRLNADDTVDKTFRPAMDGYCRAVVPMSDGKLLIGGEFTTVNGVPRAGLVRLNADGSLDTTFEPKAKQAVYTVLRQPDGKILFGGYFNSVAGVTRNQIARLNADGSLDTDFNPSIVGQVRCLTLQPDGKILVGGKFSSVKGVSRSNLARLNPDGTVDTAFNPKAGNPNADEAVFSIALQADGRILVAGDFDKMGTVNRGMLARLSADGTLDADFDPVSDGTLRGVLIDPMGRLLIGGEFTKVDGMARSMIARLDNDPAPQQLQVLGNSQVRWLRGGSSAETHEVSFDLSTDGAVTWSPLGQGSRISGGWELTGLQLPSTGKIRARARIQGGYHNSSSSLAETVAEISGLDIPQMTVERPAGTVLKNGALEIDFGVLSVGGISKSKLLTVINRGSQPLNVAGLALDGPHKEDFVLKGVPSAPFSLPGWSSMTLEVLFKPLSGADRTASIKISSNAGEGMNPFFVNLSGRGNSAPRFSGYVLRTGKDIPVTMSFESLLTRALDPEGDEIMFYGYSSQTYRGGTLDWLVEGLTYYPPPGYTGLDLIRLRVEDPYYSYADARITVHVIDGNGPPPTNTLALDRLGYLRTDLVFYGVPGQTYSIQKSLDLDSWSVIGTSIADETGAVPFADEDAREDRAFYRVASP